LTGIFRAQAPPFKAGLARPAKSALLADGRPEDLRHHKLALRLIRGNQAVAVEDLCVAGLGRTRLANSVHDAGLATFVRLLEQKAAQHGRQVIKIGRWEPTSQTCSACGYRDGPKRRGRNPRRSPRGGGQMLLCRLLLLSVRRSW
jgi:putative transposase